MVQKTVFRLVCLLLLLATLAIAQGCGSGEAALLSYDEAEATSLRQEFTGRGGGGSGGAGDSLDDPNRTPQWTTVKGVFKVDNPGAIPKLSPINVTKEPNICGTSAPNEAIEVSSTGGIKNVLIYLNTKLPRIDFNEETPVWVHPSYSFERIANGEYQATSPLQKPEMDFDQKRCIFLSHVFAMRSDQIMKIINSDATLHNAKIDGKLTAPFNGSVGGNSFITYKPTSQEVAPISVSCGVHPWMSARMIVRDAPYFAVTDENGEFEMPYVPAGVELEFRVWQEQAGFIGETVKLNGGDLKLKKGRFKQQLEGDEAGSSTTWNFEISSSVFQ